MSLPRFFLDDQVLSSETEAVFPLRLSAEDAKHARVLRLAPGEHIAVIDATQDYFECEIVQAGDPFTVRIAAHEHAPAAGPQVVLLQGLAKADKMETVIRHATEIGVSAFIPLVCDRSVVKLDAKKEQKRLTRWRSIAKSAAMQSGQMSIPEIHEPATVKQAAEALSGATAVIVCWEEAREGGIRAAIERGMAHNMCGRNDVRIAVVVGPEGGLTEAEVQLFHEHNQCASTVTLGSSILRTETAGIVAPALVIYELGGLQ